MFDHDMYQMDWRLPDLSSSRTVAEDTGEAVKVGMELLATGDFATALDLLKEYVDVALSAQDVGPSEQSLLALIALCKSELAIADGELSRSADWIYTAMGRCALENCPELGLSLPRRYLLMCAATAAGQRVLAYAPSELHVVLDDLAFGNLALAYVRLSKFGDGYLQEAVRDVLPLRNRIMDHLAKRFDSGKSQRRGGRDIVELAYQRAIALVHELMNEGRQFAEAKSIPALRDPATRVLQLVGRISPYLLNGESDVAGRLKEKLGQELTMLINTERLPDPILRRQQFEQFSSETAAEIDRLNRDGLFARIVCLPFISQLFVTSVQEVDFAESAVAPDVVVRQSTKRYPLEQVGETIKLQVEIANQGKGTAASCEVAFERPADAPITFGKSMPISVGPIPPGRSVGLECPIRLSVPHEVLALPVKISYSDVFGHPRGATDRLVIERQHQEPDWDSVIRSAPYALEPVSTLERLRGRGALIDALKVNTATGTSSVIWGQKRVGKTSVATVFAKEVLDRRYFVPVYLRRGQIAGFSEGQIARTLATKICEAAPGLEATVPDDTWFGPHLTRLTEWLAGARRRGLSRPVVIVLDEFDEISPGLYLGERGANFFATLRALSEEGVVWIFVGSERMPNIFLRHHATLNKVEVILVNRIIDLRDIEDIVVKPVEGWLEWDPDAVDLVRQLTAGNPYYIHLICSRLLREMYHARRTFVDRADVRGAADAIVAGATPNHWGHFWEDNSELDNAARARTAAKSAAFLAAFGRALSAANAAVPMSVPAIDAALRHLDMFQEDDVGKVIEVASDLLNRGVLQSRMSGDDVRYLATIPLFGEFLQAHGISVVAPFYNHYVQQAEQYSRDKEHALPLGVASAAVTDSFPIDDEELLAIANGLTYQGIQVDPIRIRNWLRQFPSDTAIVVAAKLLRATRNRYYYDMSRIRHAIDDVYKWLIEQMTESGVQVIHGGRGSRILNVHVGYLGDASKSGADVARDFKTHKSFARAASIEDALNWTRAEQIGRDKMFVLIVDDFVGTGTTAKQGLLGVVNRLRRDKQLMEWARRGRILFAPLWAFANGLDAIRSEVGDLIKIQPAHYLDSSDQAFDVQQAIWESSEERTYAEAVFRHVGQQLQRDHPLGFGNCQSLVVFHNTVPNNTLPPFWSAGFVDERVWVPLFPRP